VSGAKGLESLETRWRGRHPNVECANWNKEFPLVGCEPAVEDDNFPVMACEAAASSHDVSIPKIRSAFIEGARRGFA
jgi:hypothetical protein